MDSFHDTAFNSFNKGVGKEIQESGKCSEKKNFTLYITGIPPDVDNQGLKNMFSQCGRVLLVRILKAKQLGGPRAGFIEFGSMPEVLYALEKYGEFQLGKYVMRSSIAKKPEDRPAKADDNRSFKNVDLTPLVEESIRRNAVKAEKRMKNLRDCTKDEKGLERKMGPCVVCGKLSLPTCAQCKIVHYCGVTCQREDWVNHKAICKPCTSSPIDSHSDSSDAFMVEVDDCLVESMHGRIKALAKKNAKENPPKDTPKTETRGVTSVTLTPEGVRAGTKVNAILVDLQSSGIFYLQMASAEESGLPALDNAINSFYSHGEGKKPPGIDEGGVYVCQFSADLRWYRAYVLWVSEAKTICRVWYIDYGNCEEVPCVNLVILEENFTKKPAFSVQCKLSNCTGIDAKDMAEVVGEISTDPLVELEIKAVKDIIADVELFVMVEGMRISLNEILLKLFPEKKPVTAEMSVTKRDNGQPEERYDTVNDENESEKFLKQENTDGLSEPGALLKGGDMVALDATEKQICEKTEPPNTGECPAAGSPEQTTVKSSLENLEKIHRENLEMGSISGQFSIKGEKISKVIPKAELPAGRFDVVITNVEDVEHISCSVVGPGLEELKKLQEELTTRCESNFQAVDFKKGGMCAAKYSGGTEWYRAEMLSEVDENCIAILFIDYGNKENVSKEKICELPKSDRFWHLPRQTVLCKLSHCLLEKEKCTATAKETVLLLKKCENQIFSAEFDREYASQPNEPVPITIFVNETFTLNEFISQMQAEFPDPVPNPPKVDPPLQNVLQDLNQLDGEDFRVVLTHVETPGAFTCQLLGENQPEIEGLVRKMSQYYTQKQDQPKEIGIEKYCAVEYEVDGLWYRGEVLGKVEDSSNLYEVCFLDFGNKEKVEKCKMAHLEEEFKKLPVQGIKARLSGCGPGEDRQWSVESIAIMQSLCNQSFNATMYEKTQNSASLQLTTATGLSVSEELKKLGLVSPPLDADQKIPLEEKMIQEHDDIIKSDVRSATADVMKSDITGDAAERSATADLMKSDITGDAAESGVKIGTEVGDTGNRGGKFATGRSDVIKGDVITDGGVSDVINNNNNDIKSEVITNLSERESTALNEGNECAMVVNSELPRKPLIKAYKPKLNINYQIAITHANGPCDFHCNVVSSENQHTVQKLEELNGKYMESTSIKTEFQIGDFCVAKSPSDSRWYRARIEDVAEDGYLVYYVDFGNQEVIRRRYAQPLLEEYFEIEAQAISCSLRGCRTPETGASSECLAIMNELVGPLFEIKFYAEANGKYPVEVFLGKGLCLNDCLIKNNLVLEAEPDETVKADSRPLQDEEPSEVKAPAIQETPSLLDPPVPGCKEEQNDVEKEKEYLLEAGMQLSMVVKAVANPHEFVCEMETKGGSQILLCCTVAGVKSAGDDWTEEATALIERFQH